MELKGTVNVGLHLDGCLLLVVAISSAKDSWQGNNCRLADGYQHQIVRSIVRLEGTSGWASQPPMTPYGSSGHPGSVHFHILVALSGCSPQPLLRRLPPFQALIHPLLDPLVAPLLQLLPDHALEHLARKAHKVVSPERVLEKPVPALALLARQQLLVPKLARPDPQVAAHGEQVEADLRGLVPGYALLQDLGHLCREGLGRAGAVGDGSRLQAVELVEGSVDGGIGDEVEGVLGLARLLRLVDKGTAPGKAVVHLADQIRVAQRLASEFRRQRHGELAKVLHLGPNLHVIRLVHEHTQQGLRRAGILYRLRREEDVLGGGVVEGPVERPVGRRIRAVGRVFEEEYDAVERLQGHQLGRVEREELFELDMLDAEVLDEGCENALAARSVAGTHVLVAKKAYRIRLDCEERPGSAKRDPKSSKEGDLLVFQPPLIVAKVFASCDKRRAQYLAVDVRKSSVG